VPDVPTNNPEQFYQSAPLLLVPDVSATADFYRRILGFKADPGNWHARVQCRVAR